MSENDTEITEAVKKLCIEAAYFLNQEMMTAFKKAQESEESPISKTIFGELIENAEIAKTEMIPYCQDTGFAVFFRIGLQVLPKVICQRVSLWDFLLQNIPKLR